MWSSEYHLPLAFHASPQPVPTRVGLHKAEESMPDSARALGSTLGALGHTALLPQYIIQSPHTSA